MIPVKKNENHITPTQKKRIRLSDAVFDIRKRYPKIRQEDIRFAAMVYYPVAFVEVEAEEKSVEDFDSVQLMVLRFLALGIGKDDIVTLTGTTPGYIDKVKGLLFGYGHIDKEGNVTSIGKESIDASSDGKGRKIERKLSKRYVQLDALSLVIIPHDRRVDEITFFDKTEAYDKPISKEDGKVKQDSKLFNVGAIAYPEGITMASLKERLVCKDENDNKYDKIIGAQNIHVNITNETIKRIECLKLRYASACMLVLQGSDIPIVFGKCVAETQKRSISQWFPLGVDSKSMDSMCEQYGFEDDVRALENHAGGYLTSMQSRFETAWKQGWKQYKQKHVGALETDYLLNAIYPYRFQEKHYRWRDGELFVDCEAFETVRHGYAIAKILSAFAEDGFYRFATEDLCGHLVTIRPEEDDMLLQDVARLLKKAIEQNGARKVDRYLRDNFNERSEVGDLQSKAEIIGLEVPRNMLGKEEKKPLVLEQMKQVLCQFLKEGGEEDA